MGRLTDYKDGSQPPIFQCPPLKPAQPVRHSATGAFSAFASRLRQVLSPEMAQD